MLGPTRRQFDLGLQSLSAEALYREKLKDRFEEMHERRVPVVLSLMHLAKLSGVRWNFLRSVVRRERLKVDYHVYSVAKASGGQRWICVPCVELRAVQSWISRNILKSPGAIQQLNPASQAYADGCSILRNAKEHAASPWMVKLDISDFFESVSERQVYAVFRNLGYPALIAFEMSRICTRVLPRAAANRSRSRDVKWRWRASTQSLSQVPYLPQKSGHLPQGSPTSPMLSNLISVKIDEHLSAIAEQFGGVYTRYADDVIISFSEGNKATCQRVLAYARLAIGRHGFVLNQRKTHILGPGARKTVTGLVVNDNQPRLKRQTKNHIEVSLHYIERNGLIEQAHRVESKHPIAYLNHVSGLIHFARWVEPTFGGKAFERLRTIYEKNSEVLQTLAEFGTTEDFSIRYRSTFL